MPAQPIPAQLPRWADVTAGATVEPTELHKDSGWAPGEKPPAEYLNWLLWLIYTWLVYVKDIANQTFTGAGNPGPWTGTHDFQAGVEISGRVPGSNVQLEIPLCATGTNVIGIDVAGKGTGAAINAVGGSGGSAFVGFSSGAATGIVVSALGTGDGAYFTGAGGGKGATCTGQGVGTGIVGTGGATGAGGSFIGNGGSAGVVCVTVGGGDAVMGTGSGGGYGGNFQGGSSDGIGCRGAGQGNGSGCVGIGSGTGSGGVFSGGGTNGPGVRGNGVGSAPGGWCIGGSNGGNGVTAQGGGTSGTGLVATGGATNGVGCICTGVGSGNAGQFNAAGTGSAIVGTNNHASNACGEFTNSNAAAGAGCSPGVIIWSGTLGLLGSQPTKTQQLGVNQVSGTHVTKAWCNVTAHGDNTVSFNDGVNITSVVIDAATGGMLVTFARDFVNAFYAVTGCSHGPAFVPTRFSESTTSCIVMWAKSLNSLVVTDFLDFTLVGSTSGGAGHDSGTFDLVFHGRQI